MGLTVTRKAGERVIIGKDIIIDIRRIRGERVAINIEAPPEVKILRGELHERKESEGSDG